MLIRLTSHLKSQEDSPTLKLCDLFIGDEGCNALAEYLSTKDTFVTLDLRGNNISDGLIRLADYLASSRSLKQYPLL